MTDIPYRMFGPRPLNSGAGETLYTAPPGTQKMFIRDITFSNFHTSSITVRAAIGSIADPSKRVIDQAIAANTATFIRPLWLLDAEETFQGLQVLTTGLTPTLVSPIEVATGVDGTSAATSGWAPAANTTYVAIAKSGVASGTTALNPTSVTGTNGMNWTLVTGSEATSTVAAAVNGSIAAYWSRTTGSPPASTVTTGTWASTQHSFDIQIFSVANTYAGTVAIPPWSASAVPYAQAVAAADSTAPASTTDSKTVTLGTLQTGIVTYHHARYGASPPSSTSPAGFTELGDGTVTDASGSVASYGRASAYVITPPHLSTTVGPATYVSSATTSRVALAIEWIPVGWVNCMVSGIEVH